MSAASTVMTTEHINIYRTLTHFNITNTKDLAHPVVVHVLPVVPSLLVHHVPASLGQVTLYGEYRTASLGAPVLLTYQPSDSPAAVSGIQS